MNRHQWTFPYTADKLLEAARVKHGHHSGRLQWWDDKTDEIVASIKAEGIEIDESLADVVSNSYARGATVQIRDDLLRDLQECVQKVREHRAHCDGYSAWMQVLERQGQSSFDLHHDDWLFFFGS